MRSLGLLLCLAAILAPGQCFLACRGGMLAAPPSAHIRANGAFLLMTSQKEVGYGRRDASRLLAAAVAPCVVMPAPSLAVKAGPKLDQFPEEEWTQLVASGECDRTTLAVLSPSLFCVSVLTVACR